MGVDYSYKEKINILLKYNFNITTSEEVNGLICSVIFPDNWIVEKHEDREDVLVKYNEGKYFYIVENNEDAFDKIFNLVNKVIIFNEEYKERLEIFEEKSKELKYICDTEDIDKIRNINFVYKKKYNIKKNKLKEENEDGNK